ncbi:putative low-specificity L-threonine aldolase 1 [Chionoecetes opilio]|uniref:Putative low-specificity L-threonine aldolase 1 n=1 Tax=Chionoecetes opilio TaxID=41210 RepID=A0A8J4Y190_CHIOP|nr:putative low-specificity L-threonine aldolase 1 [Chionoecetes opilio]
MTLALMTSSYVIQTFTGRGEERPFPLQRLVFYAGTVPGQAIVIGVPAVWLRCEGREVRTMAATTGKSVPQSCVVVDLRSDTQTQPSPLMKKAMTEALLGGEVFGEDPAVKARRPRQRATTFEEDQRIIEAATEGEHAITNAVHLRNTLGLDASVDTVRRRLHAANLHCRVAAKKELLTDAHRASRLAFAEQHANKGLDFWSQVIFCDEKTFRSSDHGRVRVWRRDNTRYEPRNICTETRSGHVTCNVFGWISMHGVGDVVNIEGRFTAAKYVDLLDNFLLPSLRDRHFPAHPGPIIFVQDRSPIHTARVVRQWFAGRDDLVLLDWPSKGCDLNPIEHVWAYMVNGWERQRERRPDQLLAHINRDWEILRPLQDKVAKLLGKEAALFVPTGTMSNLVAVLTHCQQRGSEVILGHLSHIHLYEQGGISQLGGVHPRTVQNLPDGTFDLEALRGLVRQKNDHYPTTALVCVENTHNVAGGKVVPLAWVDELGATCRELGLPVHMDGARLLNAATKLDLPPERLVRRCTSVSLSLSKGLGAPVGSVLAGSSEFIQRVTCRQGTAHKEGRRGGMQKSGMLAAAGIYGLDHVYPTLARDHSHLQQLARAVEESGSKTFTCDPCGAHTNILMIECDPKKVTPQQLCQRMDQVTDAEVTSLEGCVIVRLLPMTNSRARLVVHHDVTPEHIQLTARKLQYVIRELSPELDSNGL